MRRGCDARFNFKVEFQHVDQLRGFVQKVVSMDFKVYSSKFIGQSNYPTFPRPYNNMDNRVQF